MFHVANGHSTTRLIARAGLAGDTAVWADPLHDGPVPAVPHEALRAIRAGYIAELARMPVDAVLADLLSWDAALIRAIAADELVLWFEHDLFDQLNLVHLLDRLAALPHCAATVTLISTDRIAGRERFKGFGELTPPEIAALLDTRQPIGPAHYAAAHRAWEAFRAPDPRQLHTVADDSLEPLPFLGPCLRRLLEEFPWTRDGLSRTERRLLQLTADAPVSFATLLPRMHDDERWFYIADASLWLVARRLAACTPALLTIDGETLAITADGRRVLTGSADRIALTGLDTWIGGVHLTATSLWRWNAQMFKLMPQ
jgi:hypothetical protein